MKFLDVELPRPLCEAAYLGKLVVFAGAGVSMRAPVELPGFDCLVEEIKADVDVTGHLRERGERETPEQYLGFLESHGCDVKGACSKLIGRAEGTTELHESIMRLMPVDDELRIVTTNFDKCFESTENFGRRDVKLFSAPALPLGDDFDGLVHLHGSVFDSRNMVLTAADYGRAYIAKGWAARFLNDVFRAYTVLFIGYSCNDSPIDYLTRSLSAEMDGRAFSLVKRGEDASPWEQRGVIPIEFDDYGDLPQIVGLWSSRRTASKSERVDDIRDIAQVRGALQHDASEFLLECLTWPDEATRLTFTKAFAESASKPEMLDWAFANGLIAIDSDALDDSQAVLVHWVAQVYAIDSWERLVSLCLPSAAKLSNALILEVLLALAGHEPSGDCLGAWVTLLESRPLRFESDDFARHLLVEIALKVVDEPACEEVLLALLRMLLRIDIELASRYYPEKHLAPVPVFSVVGRESDEHVVELARSCSSNVAPRLFSYCVDQVRTAYRIQTGCLVLPGEFDVLSYTRAAIEPHEQDARNGRAIDLLVDVLRELGLAATRRGKLPSGVMDGLLSSPCALLKRLGVFLMGARMDETGGDLPIKAAIEGGWLSDALLRHETFCLLRDAYPLATEAMREALVKHLCEITLPGRDDSAQDVYRYKFLVWMMEGCPDDPLLLRKKEELEKIVGPREVMHPDLIAYASDVSIDIEAECSLAEEDFTRENIRSRLGRPSKPGEWADDFEVVAIPARQHGRRAVELMDELLKMECLDELDNDLLGHLVRACEWGSLIEADEAHFIIGILERLLQRAETCQAALWALGMRAFFGAGGPKLSLDDRGRLLDAAFVCWESIVAADAETHGAGDNVDWALVSANEPSGILVTALGDFAQRLMNNGVSGSDVIAKLGRHLERVEAVLAVGSRVAGAVAAAFALYLGTWIRVDAAFAERCTRSCVAGNAVAGAAFWQGFTYVPAINAEMWEFLLPYWPHAFTDGMIAGKVDAGNLARRYMSGALAFGDNATKLEAVVRCAEAPDGALPSALWCVEKCFEGLDADGQAAEWNSWLGDSVLRTCRLSTQRAKDVSEFLIGLLDLCPSLSGGIAEIIRDGSFADIRTYAHVPAALYRAVVEGYDLSADDAGFVLARIVSLQTYLNNAEEVRGAVRLLDKAAMSAQTLETLRSALVDKGVYDTI